MRSNGEVKLGVVLLQLLHQLAVFLPLLSLLPPKPRPSSKNKMQRVNRGGIEGGGDIRLELMACPAVLLHGFLARVPSVHLRAPQCLLPSLAPTPDESHPNSHSRVFSRAKITEMQYHVSFSLLGVFIQHFHILHRHLMTPCHSDRAVQETLASF